MAVRDVTELAVYKKLDFARDCEYLTITEHGALAEQNAEIGRMLGAMLKTPEKYC
jgi:hypothetical protein